MAGGDSRHDYQQRKDNHYIKTKPSISSDPMLDFQHATVAERQKPLRNYTLISILLVLTAGSFACSSSQDGPQRANDTPVLRTLPSPTPTATAFPRRSSGSIAITNIATPTPVSGAVAASNIPFPTPTPTATPDPVVTPTATPVPKPSPTPTATSVPISPEDEARIETFYENFISISYEASFDMPNEFTESDYPVTATVEGWLTTRTSDDSSQFFTKIDMTKPVERSIEVVSRPATFDKFLHDLNANKWYFLPENSSAVDVGPLDDILNLWFYGMVFSTLPRDDTQQVPDGYIRKLEDPTYGSVIVTYDQAYTLETYIHTDPDGKELIRARYFDLNKLRDLVPYEDVEELLPDTYWKSQ